MNEYDERIWKKFRTEGIAGGMPAPIPNGWAFAAHDLMRAYRITAEWLDPSYAEDAKAYPELGQIRAAFPTDARTGAIVMHELAHIIGDLNNPDWAKMPTWKRELRADELALDMMEARVGDGPADVFTREDVEQAEYCRSYRLCMTYLRPMIQRGEITAAEVREASKRPSLLGWHAEWIGMTYRRENNGWDDDELRGFLAGPPV